jgi:hypothetical protein
MSVIYAFIRSTDVVNGRVTSPVSDHIQSMQVVWFKASVANPPSETMPLFLAIDELNNHYDVSGVAFACPIVYDPALDGFVLAYVSDAVALLPESRLQSLSVSLKRSADPDPNEPNPVDPDSLEWSMCLKCTLIPR